MQSHKGLQVGVAWQGVEACSAASTLSRLSGAGEPLPPPNQHIQHTIQTNGRLIDDEWAAFFTIGAATSSAT